MSFFILISGILAGLLLSVSLWYGQACVNRIMVNRGKIAESRLRDFAPSWCVDLRAGLGAWSLICASTVLAGIAFIDALKMKQDDATGLFIAASFAIGLFFLYEGRCQRIVRRAAFIPTRSPH